MVVGVFEEKVWEIVECCYIGKGGGFLFNKFGLIVDVLGVEGCFDD